MPAPGRGHPVRFSALPPCPPDAHAHARPRAWLRAASHGLLLPRSATRLTRTLGSSEPGHSTHRHVRLSFLLAIAIVVASSYIHDRAALRPPLAWSLLSLTFMVARTWACPACLHHHICACASPRCCLLGPASVTMARSAEPPSSCVLGSAASRLEHVLLFPTVLSVFGQFPIVL